MILSASRRTDIPAFFSEWFFNRIKEGYALVKNPFNANQLNIVLLGSQPVDRAFADSVIDAIEDKCKKEPHLSACFAKALDALKNPDLSDLQDRYCECIVFWTKDPFKMMPRLDELQSYQYYFQFTLNPYGKDIEPIPRSLQERIDTFQKLSKKLGKDRVIWRYDPVILTDQYTVEWHLKKFKELAEKLGPYTERCVVSFVDLYQKTMRNMKDVKFKKEVHQGLTQEKDIPPDIDKIAKGFADVAKALNLPIETCAEVIDLTKYGIKKGKCIDDRIIEKLIGRELLAKKDPNQRPECGCLDSQEIGAYNTCNHGCVYCYANYDQKKVEENFPQYDPHSPILCDVLSVKSVVTFKKRMKPKAEKKAAEEQEKGKQETMFNT